MIKMITANNDKKSDSSEEISVTTSTGNIFEDLGLPDSEDLLIKSNLALKLGNLIEKRQLSQLQTATILGISESEVSLLLNGKLRSFSAEKLRHFIDLFRP